MSSLVVGSSKKVPAFLFVALLCLECFVCRNECSFANAFVGRTSKRSGFVRAALSRLGATIESSIGNENQKPDESNGNLALWTNGFSVDPLIYTVLGDTESFSLESMGGIVEASEGVRIWRHALTKGRLPLESEFSATTASGGEVAWWPSQPLFSKLYDSMVALQLPRFALRHPEAITVILLSLLRLTVEYSKEIRNLREEKEIEGVDNDEDDEEEDFYFLEWQKQFQQDVDTQSPKTPLRETEDDENTTAAETARGLVDEWSGVVNGVNILDSLFGLDHGLLQVSQDTTKGAGASVGFGIQDGVWSHTGWKEIPKLQQELSDVTELKELVESLGRRPSANNSDRIQRFAPRKQQKDGALGAEFDPQLRESVEGISLSGSFSEMLPSEALLLCGKSKALRRLFLAKKVESKLLSYQLSGWSDVPSMPRTRPLYRNRLPSAPGGPIIVCLDTSWSMTGRRESLSKAVVLSCVSVAHKQGRDCQVVAFSTEMGVIEAGVITAGSKDGIERLLDFLSYSFGGGTDVTGALKYAITSLEGDLMASADILLVTDGEIPDPPISNEMMESLDMWKVKKGIQVHGLLIGKSESKPLSRICTTTHDFLSAYESPIRPSGSSQALARKGRLSTALHAKRSSFNEEGRNYSKGKANSRGGKWDEETSDRDNYDSVGWSGPENEDFADTKSTTTTTTKVAFTVAVADSVELLREVAARTVSKDSWSPEILERERAEHAPCWQTHSQLRAAIGRVEDGLVERGEDARLVVLAMVANEHILLLGSPGTGKSILGLRLAELCDGKFFQRLLTRFTTPEELFGPLSLSSLEKDEYRRCTEGFLPTADVAFLDEIFKANSAILNTLLTILNERKFDNAGGRESCPIRCVVGASNELPENDDLVALFDRFLIRKEVLPVTDDGVLTLLSMSNPGQPSCYKELGGEDHCENVFTQGFDEVVNTLSSAVESIRMDNDVCELMRDLRTYMRQEQSVEISDRRLVKAARLLKISAASDGREKVDPIDFLLLQHCFWNSPEQRTQIREWLWENLTPCDGSQGSSVEQFHFLLDNLRNEILAALRKTAGDVTGDSGARSEDLAVINALKVECGRISELLQQNLNSLARHMEIIRRSGDFLWIDPEDASAVQQLLLPRSKSLWIELEKACEDARALELSLSTLQEVPSNELRVEVIQELWEEGYKGELEFTEAELLINMKEAKSKYDLETFRRWKRAKKKLDKAS